MTISRRDSSQGVVLATSGSAVNLAPRAATQARDNGRLPRGDDAWLVAPVRAIEMLVQGAARMEWVKGRGAPRDGPTSIDVYVSGAHGDEGGGVLNSTPEASTRHTYLSTYLLIQLRV